MYLVYNIRASPKCRPDLGVRKQLNQVGLGGAQAAQPSRASKSYGPQK